MPCSHAEWFTSTYMKKSQGQDVEIRERSCMIPNDGISKFVVYNNKGTIDYAGEDIGYSSRAILSHGLLLSTYTYKTIRTHCIYHLSSCSAAGSYTMFVSVHNEGEHNASTQDVYGYYKADFSHGFVLI